MKALVVLAVLGCGILSARAEFTVCVNPGERWETARQKIRDARKAGTLKPDDPATVILRPGVHVIPVRFELGSWDGGHSERGVITYRAEKPGTVFVRGGKTIPRTAFRPDPERPGVLVADVSPYLLSEPRPWPDRMEGLPEGPWLYQGGEPLPLARWPNAGWATFTNGVDKGRTGPGAFVFEGDRVRRWDVRKGLWLSGYWTHDWADACLRVASVDPVSNVVRFASTTTFGIACGTWGAKERRFCAVNLLEELDAPGEWYLDRPAKRLYFRPVPGREGEELVLASLDQSLVQLLKGVRHVRFENLDFACSHSADAAFDVVDGTDVTVSNCTFSCLSGMAVRLNGRRVTVVDSRMRNVGGTVARLDGGDRRQLINGETALVRCDISRYGVFKQTFQPAIDLYGCGNAVRNCHVHDGPYIALWYHGNEHLIADNDFHDVVLEAGDSAAIYSGRDPSSWGNVVCGNFIHELGADSKLSEFRMGVYLDDADCGDFVVGNAFRRSGNAVFIGGGNGIVVAGNRMEDCRCGVHLDSRGTTWKAYQGAPGGRSWWHNGCRDFDYRLPPWSLAYPTLAKVVDDEPNLPWMNVFTDNVMVGCRETFQFDRLAQGVRARMTLSGNLTYTNAAEAVSRTRRPGLGDAQVNVLRSPGGALTATFRLDVAGRLVWSLCSTDGVWVARSPLGLTFDGRDCGRLVIPGRAVPSAEGAAMTIPLADLVTGRPVAGLDVRLTDRSCAFRWRAPAKGRHHVAGELSAWRIVGDAVKLTHEEPPAGLPKVVEFEREKGLTGVSFAFAPAGRDLTGDILSPWHVIARQK